MAELTKKPNTIKSIGKKVADNGNASDYVYIPIGADSDNVDRPDGSTVEESLTKVETEKVEIIPVDTLPKNDIEIYPFIYALVKPNESKGIFYEYRDNKWIKYGSDIDGNGIFVGTKLQIAEALVNEEIPDGTIVIKIKEEINEDESHTHDYVSIVIKEATYTETGLKKNICFFCGDSYEEEIPMLSDTNKPSGVIRIGDKAYTTWKDTVSFDTYSNVGKTVTIEGTDNETGVKEISYYLATASMNNTELESVTWTVYDQAFTIEPNNNYIVYAKITDNADNISYICSDGIVLDNIPPVFNGMEDGGTYPVGTVLTLNDDETLTVNGEVVELTNNSYTFNETMDNAVLSIVDRTGNSTMILISIIEIEYTNFTLTADNLSMAGISNEGDIVIPATFEKDGVYYKITEIGDDTFADCENINSVEIPDSITNIRDYVFSRCTSLTSINIPDSVKNIGLNVFTDCKSLESINLSNSLTKINFGLFNGCKLLKSVIIPETIESIEGSAFGGCTSLASINIPDNVTNIGIASFRGCTSLTSINISDNVTNIDVQAFSGCTSLASINIPDNVTNIKGSTFDGCTSLSSISISENVTQISYDAFRNCTSLNITVPDSVNTIGSNAFFKVPHVYYNGTATGSPWGALAIN